MSTKTSLEARVPALVIQHAAWATITAVGGGTTLDFSSDLNDIGGSAADLSGVNGLVAVEFDNSANTSAVNITLGSNTANIPLPGGTARTLVYDLGETTTLTGSDIDVLVTAYVKP